jgi:hypothetical protein
MDWLLELRPIRFFSFYLAVMFVLSTARRWGQYQTILSLVVRMQSRWPHLTKLVLAHRHIFLDWQTLRPLLVTLVLLVSNMLASQLVWPQADQFRVEDLREVWLAVPLVVLTTAAMVAFDVYGMLWVSALDQTLVEGYFDQAEFWLRGWKAPVVRVLSLGYVNPRQMVAQEVRTALQSAAELLHTTLRWVSIQTALRISCGLSLWGSYLADRLSGG